MVRIPSRSPRSNQPRFMCAKSAVEGVSEEARAANRRVEIRFAAKEGANTAQRGAEGELPEFDGPTASGYEQVVVDSPKIGQDDQPVGGITVLSVTEIDDRHLHGRIEVEVLDEEHRATAGSDLNQTVLGTLFITGFDFKSGRTINTYLNWSGAGPLTLATGEGHLYPYEYVKTTDSAGYDIYDIIGDQKPATPVWYSEKYVLDVIWPNPGTDTVTLEVPNRLRITDIPVEK